MKACLSHRVAEAWLSKAPLRLASLPSHVVHLLHHRRTICDIRQLKKKHIHRHAFGGTVRFSVRNGAGVGSHDVRRKKRMRSIRLPWKGEKNGATMMTECSTGLPVADATPETRTTR